MMWTITKRVLLFILTNLAVLLTINLTLLVLSTFLGVNLNPHSYQGLMIFAAVVGTSGAFISLLLSKWIAKWSMGVRTISPHSSDPQHQFLYQTVAELARRAGLDKVPEVGIYPSSDPNAFATGPSRDHSLVAVSTGLLQHLKPHEIRGVLAHEVAHIANGDMVTMTLIQGVVNTFVIFFSRLLAKIVAMAISGSRSRDDHDTGAFSPWLYWTFAMMFELALGLLGALVVAAFSRWREYRADEMGARLGGRSNMIEALQALRRLFNLNAADNSPFAAFKISSKPGGLLALFSTHPPLEDRIARLQKLPIP